MAWPLPVILPVEFIIDEIAERVKPLLFFGEQRLRQRNDGSDGASPSGAKKTRDQRSRLKSGAIRAVNSKFSIPLDSAVKLLQ
jgi:hypothetical protein